LFLSLSVQFAAQRIFEPAYGVLDLTSDLIGFAFAFKFAVPSYFTRDLFHFALRLLG
jgi:hypothetical protein